MTREGGSRARLITSPEQLLGREVDYRSDIFSIGVMLVEALTGARQLPNAASAAAPAASKTLEPALRDLLAKCLAAEAGDRPSSVTELLATLSPLLRAIRT
jgi:serine/threonine protein kinase